MADSTVRQRALDWIKRNPDIWLRFKRHAMNEASHKRRVSVQWLLEDVRKFDRVDGAGDVVKVNNNFASIFARELVRQCPEIRPFIELRHSSYDDD